MVARLDLPIMASLISEGTGEVNMVIGEAAKASGVSAKMLRYYESIGLIPDAARTASGYRTFGERDLGLSMDRIKLLVGLWHDRARPSREVKRIAQEHVAELRAKISELTSMCETLEELARTCQGDNRPDCPILRDLAAGGGRGRDSVKRTHLGTEPRSSIHRDFAAV
jgi:MerR family copper efflux transcriptional regulator